MSVKTTLLESIAATGKALSSGTRLHIIEMLAQKPRPVGELAAMLSANLTTVSAHLQVLREAGLVTSRRDGTSVTYSLASADVARLLDCLVDVAEAHQPLLMATRHQAIPDGVVAVTRDEFEHLRRSGPVTVIDVRPRDEFEAGHIPGASSFPLAELEQRLGEIPADVEIVAYCRGRYCVLSWDAAAILSKHGRTVKVLADGTVEWQAAGLIATPALDDQ